MQESDRKSLSLQQQPLQAGYSRVGDCRIPTTARARLDSLFGRWDYDNSKSCQTDWARASCPSKTHRYRHRSHWLAHSQFFDSHSNVCAPAPNLHDYSQ